MVTMSDFRVKDSCPVWANTLLYNLNLNLNITKTKEMVVDFSREKKRSHYAPLKIYGTLVEKLSSYRCLCVHISGDLTWTTHITSLVMWAAPVSTQTSEEM